MKVAIIGHAASPVRGSEPGLSWNWAWHLSQHHEIWLVTYPEFRDEVETYLAAHPNPRLHIVWAENAPGLDPWQPGSISTGLRFKVHYLLWTLHVYRLLRSLIPRTGIQLVHHVGLVTISAPSLLWRLPAPLVWGPLGGGQRAPSAFQDYYGPAWRTERLRGLRIRLASRSAALGRTVRHARCVLATNRETEQLLRLAGAAPSRLRQMADNGLRKDAVRSEPRTGFVQGALRVLWAGRLETRKALPILLDALALLSPDPSLPPVRVAVAGEGPLRAAWEAHARARGVGHDVTFLGAVPYGDMQQLMETSDLLAFTSLQDSMGSVVLEAFSRALPAIVLDHQGAVHYPDAAAVKVPVVDPATTVRALAVELDRLRRQPERLAALSVGALATARRLEWPSRALEMSGIYRQAVLEPVA